MKILRAGFAIAAFAVLSLAFGDDVTKQLEANYAAITSAFKHKDIKAIGDFMAPGFSVHLDNGSTMSRDKVLADYATEMKMITDITWTRKVGKTTRQGAAIVAQVDGTINGTMIGPDSKKHKLLLIAAANDTWQKKGNKWFLINTVVTKRNAFIDGKARKLGGN